MINIYYVGYCHHKNLIGLELMKPYFNIHFIDYKKIPSINKEDSILIISDNINYKSNDIKTIYGPHIDFRVSATGHGNDNKILNMLSEWNVIGAANFNKNPILNENICKTDSGVTYISLPFPVDINKFIPTDKKNTGMLYLKNRSTTMNNLILNWIKEKQLILDIFEYGYYSEESFLKSISKSSYAIWVGRHESQGFAFEETLSCNTPIFVLDVDTLYDEKDGNNNSYWNCETFKNVKATAASYWTNQCGKICKSHNKDEIDNEFNVFFKELHTYEPRKFIVDNLSAEPVSKLWTNTIQKLF